MNQNEIEAFFLDFDERPAFEEIADAGTLELAFRVALGYLDAEGISATDEDLRAAVKEIRRDK